MIKSCDCKSRDQAGMMSSWISEVIDLTTSFSDGDTILRRKKDVKPINQIKDKLSV